MTVVCVRRAWLTLPDGRRVDLEGRGYFCSKLDLGSPTVREVVNNRPDNSGTVDRTAYMGSRVVSADLVALSTAGARIDEVAAAFGPFMDPGARPTLHYVLDRGENPERTLVLRGAAFGWPIAGPTERDIQLQWVAPDPLALDPAAQLATAWAATGTAGRAYDRTYDRTYPAGSGGAVAARVVTRGDTWVRPVLRIYGPLSAALVTFQPDSPALRARVPFVSAFRIDAGRFVTVDTDAHSAYFDDDPTQSVLSSLDWWNVVWPVLWPSDGYTMSVTGTGAGSPAQVQATWHDRYFA